MTTGALSAGVRVAGSVTAFGYLFGIGEDSIVTVVGALALITFGHALVLPRGEEVIAGVALGVVAVALGVVAIRWETLSVTALRDVQAVFGPTVLVGSEAVVAGAWIAAISTVLAVALCQRGAALHPRSTAFLSGGETLVWVLAIVSIFWGPAIHAGDAAAFGRDVAMWIASVAVTAAVTIGTRMALARRSARFRLLALGAAVAGVAAGAVLMTV